MDPSKLDRPHRRRNLLTGEHVLVSPHRTLRPWLGSLEKPQSEQRVQRDPACYLCPQGVRANGEVNPNYTSTYVFQNDFAALMPQEAVSEHDSGLLQWQTVSGECRVVCFSPRHDLSLAELDPEQLRRVVDCWIEQSIELSGRYSWVQIFENKGAVMGCSNPHPHGQIWASSHVPTLVSTEDKNQSEHWNLHGTSLLLDVLDHELKIGERIVEANDSWVWLVPFWATWPYECLLVPRRQIARINELTEPERDGLADILKKGLVRYDNLFETSFPYSMGWHGAPYGQESSDHWQLHAHFYPPLLRSESVKKFMVGYEMLAEAQRDITPEQAAENLRATSTEHYSQRTRS